MFCEYYSERLLKALIVLLSLNKLFLPNDKPIEYLSASN